MKSHSWRICFLALVALSASCSSKENGEIDAGTPESHAETTLLAENQRNDWIERWRTDTYADKDPRKLWDQYSKSVQADLSRPGADPSDLIARADQFGSDPDEVFEFVRDQITLEPYAGVLRGARGTLMASAGNALDRALLAQELLKAKEIETRLIAGVLSSAQVDRLLARYFDASAIPMVLSDLVKTADDTLLKSEASDLATKVNLPASNIEDLLRYARAREREFWAKTDAQRATHYDFLASQLQKSGMEMTNDGAALTSKLKERLRKHYWLQIKESDGTWSDFDPSFSDSKRGMAYASNAMEVSEIPEREFHRLEFSLVYQTATDGAAHEEVLLSGTFASSDVLFKPLEFFIQPADSNVDLGTLLALQVEQRIEALRNLKVFQGFLRFGSEATGGRKFDLDGTTYDASAPSLGNAAGSFFGDSFGDGGAENQPDFVNLRVVMRFIGPDRQTAQQTRTLVKAEDLMEQNFAPPLLNWELLLQPQWLSAKFVEFHELSQLIANTNANFVALSTGQPQEFFEKFPPSVPVLLIRLSLLRQTAGAAILAKQKGVKALIDAPLLTIMGNGIKGIDEQGRQITGERFVDIVENSVRYVAKGEASQSSTFDAALHQSVADSALEDLFLRHVSSNGTDWSGATIVEQARSEQRPVLFANARDSDKLKGGGLPESDVNWIQENETSDARLVVTTTQNGSSAWWSVLPDGNAILRTQGGRGGSGTSERGIKEGLITFKNLKYVAKIGLMVACLTKIAAAGLQKEEMSDSQVIKMAICSAASGVSATTIAAGWTVAGYLVLGADLAYYAGLWTWNRF